MKDERSGISFSKFIVSLVIALNIAFALTILYIVYMGGQEPQALVVAWFAFTTGELFFLSSIKKKEIVEDDQGEDEYVK